MNKSASKATQKSIMSLSISFGKLAAAALPKLPEIKLRIPNPFQQQKQQQTHDNSSLKQRLQGYLENRTPEESFFIDNGFLKAVPKKKVSHQRKRKRQLAPASKQLKYLHHLNRCPSCGHYKRAHTLCMHCVLQIKNLWKKDITREEIIPQELSDVDRKIIYPGKKQSDYEKELAKKEYILRRQRTLPVDRK